jgi:hypothetical protein
VGRNARQCVVLDVQIPRSTDLDVGRVKNVDEICPSGLVICFGQVQVIHGKIPDSDSVLQNFCRLNTMTPSFSHCLPSCPFQVDIAADILPSKPAVTPPIIGTSVVPRRRDQDSNRDRGCNARVALLFSPTLLERKLEHPSS